MPASALLEMMGQAFVLFSGDHAVSVKANSALVMSGLDAGERTCPAITLLDIRRCD
ncbi:hypothetical protein [Microtetraspora niveoalba]|uniref:hypothetical protein n=1 Tax=Microtetraspora niveoalba TaxID=46175 RepID=UPI000A48EC92|nr:hypothetical protein [Microtetraspora niveoalba]